MHRIIIFIFRRLPNSNSLIIPRARTWESPMAHLSRHQFKTHLQKAFSAASHLKPTSSYTITCFGKRKIVVNAQNKEQNSTPLINTWRQKCHWRLCARCGAAKLIDAIIAHPFHFARQPRQTYRKQSEREKKRIYLSICGLSFLGARDKNLSNNLIIMKTMKRVSSRAAKPARKLHQVWRCVL